MMISSMFKKTYVTNELAEQQLYLYYREMNPAEQEKKERSILRQAEEALKGKMGYLGEMHADVLFYLGEEKSYLFFNTGFEVIQLEVSGKGELTFVSTSE